MYLEIYCLISYIFGFFILKKAINNNVELKERFGFVFEVSKNNFFSSFCILICYCMIIPVVFPILLINGR